MKSPDKTVSVITPCRNESAYINLLLDNITSQTYPANLIEVLIADGMSDDGTRDILQLWQNKQTNLQIIDNPKLIVSTGLNQALKQASGEIIVRMDVHTHYAKNYIEECVKTLVDHDVDNVGGPWRAACDNYLQCAIAAAFQSPFAVGGARSHKLDYNGPVDTVYLGCWYREKLIELGGFDEELVRNQDDELNFRIIESGGKVYQSSSIKSWYYPRSSLFKLFTQYAQYGYWKTHVVKKYGKPASLRHMIPAIFLIALLTATISFAATGSSLPLLAILVPYLSLDLLFSLRASIHKSKLRLLPVLPIIFPIFHLGYGYGFLRGLADFILRRSTHSGSFTKLTRK